MTRPPAILLRHLLALLLLPLDAESLMPKHQGSTRRKWLNDAAMTGIFFGAGPHSALAAIDVSGIKREGETEEQAIVRQIKNAGKIDPENVPFVVLDSGVQYAEYKSGKGDDTVDMGKRVAVKCTGRFPALATKEAPGGLQFFNSKLTDIQELNWRLGDGSTVAGLEEGMLGMKRGSLRRIIVPDAYFTNKSGEKLRKGLQPQPNGERGQRWFDSVVNNPRRDQTVVFEVEVERIERRKTPSEAATSAAAETVASAAPLAASASAAPESEVPSPTAD